MKKIIVLIVFVSSLNSLYAQDLNRNQKLSAGIEFRYINTFDVVVDYLIGPNSDFDGTYGKSIRFNLGYFINPLIYCGLSVGADRYEVASANTLPLTLNARYYFKDARNTIYTFAEGGPIISFSTATDKGYTSALGIGYKFFISNRTCLTTSIGYNYEKSNLDKVASDFLGDYLSRKSILVGLGLHF